MLKNRPGRLKVWIIMLPAAVLSWSSAIALSCTDYANNWPYTSPTKRDATYIYEANPTTNYSTNSNVRTGIFGASGKDYALLKFDLSCLSTGGCTTVSGVSFRMTTQQWGAGTSIDLVINRMTTDWTVGGATWNTRDGTNAWAGGGTISSSDWTTTNQTTVTVNQVANDTVISFDITNMVNDWLTGSSNYGIVVRGINLPDNDEYVDWVLNAAGVYDRMIQINAVCTPGTPTPSVQLTKTITKTVATIGDTITYCINYQNNATYEIATMDIWDTIPAVTDFITGDSGFTTANFSGNIVVSWTETTVAATESGSKCFSVRVARYPYDTGGRAGDFALEPTPDEFWAALERETEVEKMYVNSNYRGMKF